MRKYLLISILIPMTFALAVTGCNRELSVTGVSPVSAPLSGGHTATILGSGFDPNMNVEILFGNAPARDIVIKGTDKISVTIPAGSKEGKIDILVTFQNGKTYRIEQKFQYFKKASSLDIRDLGQRKSIREKKKE